MTLTVEWLIEGRALVIVAPPVIDTAALHAYDADMLRHLEAAMGDVFAIIDVRQLEKLVSITPLLGLAHIRHARFKHAMTVGLSLNAMARFFVPLASQMLGIQYKDFRTLDEARTYINVT